jgi:hypothetical protein
MWQHILCRGIILFHHDRMLTEHKTIVGIVLMVVLFLISIPFEKRYSSALSYLAQEPSTRLLAGVLLLYLSYQDIVLGSIAFIILFLWMSDIHLLSSLKIEDADRQT